MRDLSNDLIKMIATEENAAVILVSGINWA